MWTCPKCGRSFLRRDQNHACARVTVEGLFHKRRPALRLLYDRLVRTIRRFGDFREEAVNPGVIFFKTRTSFLGVKLRKDDLVVTFYLDHLEDAPSIFRHLQTSRRRFAHSVTISEPEDITPQLRKWIKRSYALTASA